MRLLRSSSLGSFCLQKLPLRKQRKVPLAKFTRILRIKYKYCL